jgi:hypothetical protein
VSDVDELRALIREVIRDVLPNGLPMIETVDLSTDGELASFVDRLLDLSPGERDEIRSGRKRFRLAPAAAPPAPAHPAPPPPARAAASAQGAPPAQAAVSAQGVPPARAAANGSAAPHNVRRIERGAVTEAMVSQAVRAGERLVLGRGAVLTPLARDRARASGVQIDKER